MSKLKNALDQCHHLISQGELQTCQKILDEIHPILKPLYCEIKGANIDDDRIKVLVDVLNYYSGILIDFGGRKKDVRTILIGIGIQKRIKKINNKADINYNIANGLSELLSLESNDNPRMSYKKNTEKIDEIKIHYCQSISFLKEKSIFPHTNDAKFLSMCLTNYASFLRNYCARVLDAYHLLSEAIFYDPTNPVTYRERGYCIDESAQIVDEDVRSEFRMDAYFDLLKSVKYETDIIRKEILVNYINKRFKKEPSLNDLPENECEHDYLKEITDQYRKKFMKYMHDNDLYLNIFKKEHNCSSSYYDSIGINTITSLIEESKWVNKCFHYLNIMKHDYAFSRILLYDYINKRKDVEFVEKDIRVSEICPGQIYSIYINMIVGSIKIALSLFDKVAVAVNHYLKIGISEKKVSIKSYNIKKKSEKDVKKLIKYINNENNNINPYLYSIIDIARDIDSDIDSDIKEIRNTYEHRFGGTVYYSYGTDVLNDDCGGSITVEELYNAALKSMKKAKSLIMYYVLLINYEEGNKAEPDGYVPIMEVPNTPDKYKGIV
jgi:LA2681-like HEPN